jgi:beta-fructofuranosidase
MTYDFGGHLDHGCFYAANSFQDPVSKKQIVWGWITEDDLCDGLRHRQGWSGMLSLPRELRMQTLRHVTSASASKLEGITNIEREADETGTFTVRTLGSEPVESVRRSLRQRKGVKRSHLGTSALGPVVGFTKAEITSSQWELQCSFRLSSRCRKIGMRISHTPDFQRTTGLVFQPGEETFKIERPSFSIPESQGLINTAPEVAPHTLFTTRDPSTGCEETETLDISAWRDNSVLEVFVNGRTAISTRLYAAEETFGIQFIVEDYGSGDDGSELVFATLWDGIGCN